MKLLIYYFFALIIFISCTQSGRRRSENQLEPKSSKKPYLNKVSSTIIKMHKIDGVNQFPVEINGIQMYFIFDTGAGMVSISNVEANFLFKQGSLTKEDILGKANFIDANGDISEGTIINLRSIKIGEKIIYNIQASVVNNIKAPLLLGQTALEKFGKISIDNKRGEITFE